ncbi:tachykinin-like peptides receptor 86C [Nomia melanderi]|uniref:tachykinin-like peptides receptor 86C n=1 Tax=Nomia melanderi TaxID=2448451 RepID=UPI001304226F|nr:tachykinin-like peptides receptor 86C [Nomia melanderi]
MNNQTLNGLYNCGATLLGHNITFLLTLNNTELLKFLEDTLDTSNDRDVLFEAFIDCVSVHQERPFDLPWWQKLAWSLIFAVMLLIATGGNVIVIWIVLAHRRMRTVTNYFLVNLSVADLMMSLLNCAFNFTFLLNSSWPFGVIYCTINNFVAHLTVASSVFTLVVISVDRYMAIMRPLKHRISRKMTVMTMILIWTIGSALALPCLLYSTTKSRRYLNGKTRITCYLLWPDGDYLHSTIEYSYNIVFLSVTYLIPIMLMAVCYALMGRKLWVTKSIGELTHYQKNLMKSKRKVVKMFITVVAIFAICWLPYHGFFIYVYHHRHFAEISYVPHIYLGFYWLAMSNAMVNPIIYYWMNTTFRVYFQLIICKCCYSMNQRNTNSHRKQQLVKCQQSDVIRCGSKRVRLNSVRWKHSTVDSQVQNCRILSIVEKNRYSQDAAIV